MPGYEIERFVNVPESEREELTCSICHDIFLCPVVAPCCLQTFCQDCIQQWIREYKLCPFDRKKLNEHQLTPAPRALTNLLGRLMIHCNYYSGGCNEIVSLDTLPQHLTTCQYRTQNKTCSKCLCEVNSSHNCIQSLLEANFHLKAENNHLKELIEDLTRNQLENNAVGGELKQKFNHMNGATRTTVNPLTGPSTSTSRNELIRNQTDHTPGYEHMKKMKKFDWQWTIKSDRVQQIMFRVDRSLFCADSYSFSKAKKIGFGSVMIPPQIHAQILELIQPKLVPGAKVLDIGSGNGYLTVCMALMVGPSGSVVGIDHVPELVRHANKIIEENYPSISESIILTAADGRNGFEAMGPYDVINVGAAVTQIPSCLENQLNVGGRLVIPIDKYYCQKLVVFDKDLSGKFTKHGQQYLYGRLFPLLTDLETQINNNIKLLNKKLNSN